MPTMAADYDVTTFTLLPATFGKSIDIEQNLAKPSKNKAAVQIKDAAFVAPSPGGSADPTIAGATFTITNPTTHETFTQQSRLSASGPAWSNEPIKSQ